jgi:phage replication O-like protein O
MGTMSDNQKGHTGPLPEPNYTQLPNIILDSMAFMKESELRVVLAIARKTFGWHKVSDQISLTQLEALTGLSRSAVVAGITAGMERGVIERTPHGKQSFLYHLLVVSDDQFTKATSSPRQPDLVALDNQFEPELVVLDYTQKKGLKQTLNKDRSSSSDSSFEDDEPEKPLTPHQAIMKAYQDALGYPIPDGARAGKAAKQLVARGVDPADVGGCLQYLHSDPWWEGKHVSLESVAKQLGPWIQAGRPSQHRDAYVMNQEYERPAPRRPTLSADAAAGNPDPAIPMYAEYVRTRQKSDIELALEEELGL